MFREGRMVSLNETLHAGSVVRLFGRKMTDIRLEGSEAANDAALARIYGFSFEGQYYKLAAPSIFKVHGAGTAVPAGQSPIELGLSGVELTSDVFAKDVSMWAVDSKDRSVRLDAMAGTFEEILLAP